MDALQNWKPEFDREKFAATVLYLLRASEPARPGLTALLKMLWYSDYKHYQEHLRPITGADYVALENGPVIDDYKDHFKWLRSAEYVKLTRKEVQGHDRPKQEYVPLMEANEDLLTESEQETLDRIAQKYARVPGSKLSEKTHREGPWTFVWDSSQPYQEIPYPLFRWVENLPDDEDLEKAAEEQLNRPEVQEILAALN